MTSVVYTTTVDLVEVDTTSIEYVSTQYTDTTTTLPTKTITITSITSYSTTNVAFTTTSFTTSTATATVPKTTTTVQIANQYSLVYGPVDGCAYLPEYASPFFTPSPSLSRSELHKLTTFLSNWISQTGSEFPAGNTHAERVAFCAQWCDNLPGCKTFGMNWFPPCKGNGDYVYCIAASESWVPGKVQCGIGTGWDGCPIYRDGTIYQYVVGLHPPILIQDD